MIASNDEAESPLNLTSWQWIFTVYGILLGYDCARGKVREALYKNEQEVGAYQPARDARQNVGKREQFHLTAEIRVNSAFRL